VTRPLLILTCALLLAPALTHAQAVRGVVVEDGTSRPVAGAVVDILHRGSVFTTARTDSAGGFLLFPRISGRLGIRVQHPFYSAIDSVAIQLKPGETVTVELRLGRTAIPLEPLRVTARTESRLSGFHERRRHPAGFGQFITRADIDTRPGAQTTDLFRQMRGVEVTTLGRGGADQPAAFGTPDPSMPRTRILTMRGTLGSCIPAIYIDGLAVRQFNDSGVDDFLKPEMIEGVEVYPGSVGAPAEFVDPTLCGVVAFWTRAGLEHARGWSWTRAALGSAAFVLLVALTR
jgi:hypothetical protein